jgi:hypothetical protein
MHRSSSQHTPSTLKVSIRGTPALVLLQAYHIIICAYSLHGMSIMPHSLSLAVQCMEWNAGARVQVHLEQPPRARLSDLPTAASQSPQDALRAFFRYRRLPSVSGTPPLLSSHIVLDMDFSHEAESFSLQPAATLPSLEAKRSQLSVGH